MKKAIFSTNFILLSLLSSSALGGSPPIGVPEIDGGGLIIALGFLTALVAIVREKFYK